MPVWTRSLIFTGFGVILGLCLIFSPPVRQIAGIRPVFAAEEDRPPVIVIDPGHGGEDGGAVSPEGIEESGINLAVSQKIRDLLIFMGIENVMTRTEDISIGDMSLNTVKKRKASDIRKRVEIVNGIENAVLISIHQNSLPESPVTHGAQVFWNAQGENLADLIQEALNQKINAGNVKKSRRIDSGIYLMSHANAPAALVECGFLSNFAETMKLKETNYQKEIALAVTAGILNYINYISIKEN